MSKQNIFMGNQLITDKVAEVLGYKKGGRSQKICSLKHTST